MFQIPVDQETARPSSFVILMHGSTAVGTAAVPVSLLDHPTNGVVAVLVGDFLSYDSLLKSGYSSTYILATSVKCSSLNQSLGLWPRRFFAGV